MKHNALLLALLSVAASSAMAAEPLGTLTGVDGQISVGGKGFVTRAKAGTPLFDGSSVMAAADSGATVQLAEGCTVVLKANQHLTVNNKLTCGQMQASVKNLLRTHQVAQVGIGSTVGATQTVGAITYTWLPVAMVGGVATFGWVVSKDDNKQNSPS